MAKAGIIFVLVSAILYFRHNSCTAAAHITKKSVSEEIHELGAKLVEEKEDSATGFSDFLPDILSNLPIDQASLQTDKQQGGVKEIVVLAAENDKHNRKDSEHEHEEIEEWDGDEEHGSQSYFGDISEHKEDDEGEESDYEWMEESARAKVKALTSAGVQHETEPQNSALDQVETGLVYLLKTAHRNGLTASDIINHLQERLQAAENEKKHPQLAANPTTSDRFYM